DTDGHVGGRVQRGSQKMADRRQGPALEAALHRSDLPTDAGSHAVSARQWFQDLHCDRRRPGFRACLCRACVRCTARAGRRHGRRPYAAFGNSDGDRQMLEYTGAGDGARLKMLVMHDDAKREYAYGPAQGLPASKVGTFTQALYDEAKKKSWIVISMKNDWKRIFAFEQPA